MKKRKRTWVRIRIAILAAPLLIATSSPEIRAQETQSKDARPPSFEVASIKLEKSRAPLPGIHLIGDRFDATITANDLIEWAYSPNNRIPLPAVRVLGGPDWSRSELFVIDAKVENPWLFGKWKNLSWDEQWAQCMLMVQSLLADRFKPKIAHESKVLPIYALVVSKNGPKFTEDNSPGWSPGGHAPGEWNVKSMSMSDFALIPSRQPEVGRRIVVDKTGLQGRYSFKLRFTPENLAASRDPSGDGARPADFVGPSIFTALQQELGLKLESTKAPVDVLVIDDIERPSEN